MRSLLAVLFFMLFLLPKQTQAIYDPTSVPNNRFGIHIISASVDEASPAASLVNSSGGDWGYITVLIESKERKVDKWQTFFNDLRRRHLIPIVRLATQPEGDKWLRPYDGEEEAWANFLSELNWPTKNRYVIIYNEPNHATEWGGSVDPADYAKALDKTITALKKKSDDFFVLNAGFDASSPHQPPKYFDEQAFMVEMEKAIPGIFNKLDGFTSHSYPNPGFVGLPTDFGRGSIGTWQWEKEQLTFLGVNKQLPVFISETGWKHSDGVDYNPFLPPPGVVSKYYEQAFTNIWNNGQIIAVTPFLLNYQEKPFDHFSFKKIKENSFHPQFSTVSNLPKVAARPTQEDKASLIKGEVFHSLVADQSYVIPLTFKNTGQSIWNEYEQVQLLAVSGGKVLGIEPANIPIGVKVEPGKEHTFYLKLRAPKQGEFKLNLNLARGGLIFSNSDFESTTKVESPVILKVKASLKWKENFNGDYMLSIVGVLDDVIQKINLNQAGESIQLEVSNLLPDYEFVFTLERPFYKPKTIRQTLRSGVNILDFGELEPNLVSALLVPKELWKLLPFSD